MLNVLFSVLTMQLTRYIFSLWTLKYRSIIKQFFNIIIDQNYLNNIQYMLGMLKIWGSSKTGSIYKVGRNCFENLNLWVLQERRLIPTKFSFGLSNFRQHQLVPKKISSTIFVGKSLGLYFQRFFCRDSRQSRPKNIPRDEISLGVIINNYILLVNFGKNYRRIIL